MEMIPYRRQKIPAALRALVWNTYIGEERGTWKCMCGGWVSQLKFECGHVIPVSKGGNNSLENLRPVCNQCNKSMGTMNLFDYIRGIGVDPNNLYYASLSSYQRPISDVIFELAEVVMSDAVSAFLKRSVSSTLISPGTTEQDPPKELELTSLGSNSATQESKIFQGPPDITHSVNASKQLVSYSPSRWVWPVVTSARSGLWWGLKTTWWLMRKAAKLVTSTKKK